MTPFDRPLPDRPLVYVAAPYTKPDPVWNTHLAIQAGERILAAGLGCPLVPHTSLLWHLVAPHEETLWYELDRGYLARCDVMLRLPGASTGCDLEVEFAEQHGIPVVYSEAELHEWLVQQHSSSTSTQGLEAT